MNSQFEKDEDDDCISDSTLSEWSCSSGDQQQIENDEKNRKFSSHPQQFHNLRKVAALTISHPRQIYLEEKFLIDETLRALCGFGGKVYLWAHENSRFEISDIVVSDENFVKLTTSSKPIASVLNDLAVSCTIIAKLRSRCEALFRVKSCSTLQHFAMGLYNILTWFQRKIVKSRTESSPSDRNTWTLFSIKVRHMPLLDAMKFTYELIENERIKSVLDDLISVNAKERTLCHSVALFINEIWQAVEQKELIYRDLKSEMLEYLFVEMIKPQLRFIDNWIEQGLLLDVYNEFFIHERHSTQDKKYVLINEAVPVYLNDIAAVIYSMRGMNKEMNYSAQDNLDQRQMCHLFNEESWPFSFTPKQHYGEYGANIPTTKINLKNTLNEYFSWLKQAKFQRFMRQKGGSCKQDQALVQKLCRNINLLIQNVVDHEQQKDTRMIWYPTCHAMSIDEDGFLSTTPPGSPWSKIPDHQLFQILLNADYMNDIHKIMVQFEIDKISPFNQISEKETYGLYFTEILDLFYKLQHSRQCLSDRVWTREGLKPRTMKLRMKLLHIINHVQEYMILGIDQKLKTFMREEWRNKEHEPEVIFQVYKNLIIEMRKMCLLSPEAEVVYRCIMKLMGICHRLKYDTRQGQVENTKENQVEQLISLLTSSLEQVGKRLDEQNFIRLNDKLSWNGALMK